MIENDSLPEQNNENESDSDNEIGNLNVPPKKLNQNDSSNLIDNSNNNISQNNNNTLDHSKLNPISELYPSYKGDTDQKTQTHQTLKTIKIFLIALFVSLILFAVNISLGIFIWVYKGSFFGAVFFIIGIYSFLVSLFNIVSAFFFQKKFQNFVKNSFNSNSDIDILKEGDSYDEFRKSTESSLMNLGMYLLMSVLVVHFIFTTASFSFHSTVKSEINTFANNKEEWVHIFNNYSYKKIISYLTSFIISFGALSLLSIGFVGYIFYLSFSVLGFFQIYQKIVQFISMLFLQVGIIFLYLTIYMSWFKNLSLLEESFIEWLPIALIVSSVIVILISLFGYVGAKNRNVTWLVVTCAATALFIAMFVVFSFCSAISAKSLQKFDDNKCPIFIDYFNEKYIEHTLSCEKYSQVANTINELNCPKERIVTYWENQINLPIEQKKFMYGCINMSCCYQNYNFIQGYNNYITILCFVIVIFGLILIGTSFFFINLLQKKFSVSANENKSQYFVYCFVGIITIIFIVLLARIQIPKYSPSFENKFNETVEDNRNDVLLYNPFSVIKANTTYLDSLSNINLKDLMSQSVIYENFGHCDESANCVLLTYFAEVSSDTYKIAINDYLVRDYGFTYKYDEGSDQRKVSVYGDATISHRIFEFISLTADNINPKICEMKPIPVNIVVKAISTTSYNPNKSNNVKQNSQQTVLMQLLKKIKKEVKFNPKLVTKTFQDDTNNLIYSIDMSQVESGTLYTIIEGNYDMSLITKEKQAIKGNVLKVENGEFVPVSDLQISFSYLNFPFCSLDPVTTDSKGKFISPAFPLMKNNVKNEVKIIFGNGELTKIVLLGGIGSQSSINLHDIVLQKDLYANGETAFPFSFTSYVVDSITVTPVTNVTVLVYEGEVYFPNSHVNDTKFYYETLNNDHLVMSTKSDIDGKFTFKNILDKEVFTFLFEKSGYYKKVYYFRNSKDKKKVYSFAMIPIVQEDGQYRIALEWPKMPHDLNLFSFFRSSDKDQCEVFFGKKNCQFTVLNNENYNNGTQGSQVITIEKLGNYTYTFAVKKFVVNDDPIARNEIKAPGAEGEAPKDVFPEFMRNGKEEFDLPESNGTVSIYVNGYKKEVFTVNVNDSKNNKGEWWVVFCLDGKRGISSLRTINEFYEEQPNFSFCEKIYEKEK